MKTVRLCCGLHWAQAAKKLRTHISHSSKWHQSLEKSFLGSFSYIELGIQFSWESVVTWILKAVPRLADETKPQTVLSIGAWLLFFKTLGLVQGVVESARITALPNSAETCEPLRRCYRPFCAEWLWCQTTCMGMFSVLGSGRYTQMKRGLCIYVNMGSHTSQKYTAR